MADSELLRLKSGIYQIVSLKEGHPNVNVYVFLQGQSESPYQPVRLDADNLEWQVEHVGRNVYRFGVGPYKHTGEREKEVIASNGREYEREWFVHYKENHDAYLITIDHEGTIGWTSGEPRSPITIGPIPSTKSLPPQYFAQNLFRFEPFGRPE